MTKTISLNQMRDHLLARLDEPVERRDWISVLSAKGNRELLKIIATQNPASISALAELAGRAQPNVSRSLNALVESELVAVEVEGKRTVPKATALGREKAAELGLLTDQPPANLAHDAKGLFSVEFADDCTLGDIIDGAHSPGILTTWLWIRTSQEISAAKTDTNLDLVASHVLQHWWRMLYRRDAPFRLWDFEIKDNGEGRCAFLVTSRGRDLEVSARCREGKDLDLENSSRLVGIGDFSHALLRDVVKPVAAQHWLRGHSSTRLHHLLARIEDSLAQPDESEFCRTAGALGMEPYDLSDSLAQKLRELICNFSDEEPRLDFCSAVLTDGLNDGVRWTADQVELHERRNRLTALAELRDRCISEGSSEPTRPFKQGIALARSIRKFLGMQSDQAVDGINGLSRALGASQNFELSPKAPGSLRAFQTLKDDSPVVIVEDEGPVQSTFLLARAVGDFLAFGSKSSCVADLYTSRQAVGRAFAAEFLAPSEAVIRMILEEDRPSYLVAKHFGVSGHVIRHQYENNAVWA